MKKNKGIIYIYTILLTCLISVIIYFVYSYISKGSILNFRREDIINSQYKAESIINILVADETFEDKFREFYLSDEPNRVFSPTFLPENTELERCFISKSPNSHMDDKVTITVSSMYKNIKSEARLIATAINEIYKNKTGIVNSSNIRPNNLKLIKEKFNKFDTIDKYKIIRLEGDFIIKKIKSNYFVCEEKIAKNENDENENIIEEPIHKISNDDILIQDRGTIIFKNSIISSIFLIVNDKVLFNDYDIHGIIVLNEKAQVSKSLNLKGYLVDLYDKNTYSNVEYSESILKKFRDALPNYVQFEPVALNYFETE